MDVLVVPSGPRLDDVVEALREAADVYGWGLESETAQRCARVRIVPGTCTRQPEARRVLERARHGHADLLDGVAVERVAPADT